MAVSLSYDCGVRRGRARHHVICDVRREVGPGQRCREWRTKSLGAGTLTCCSGASDDGFGQGDVYLVHGRRWMMPRLIG